MIVCKMCRDKKDIINFAFNIKFKNCTDDTCSDCRKEIAKKKYKARLAKKVVPVEKKRKKRVVKYDYVTKHSDTKCFDCNAKRSYNDIVNTGTLLCKSCFKAQKERLDIIVQSH